MMNEMNKTSKAAYIMSGISAILNGLVLLAMLVGTIFVFVEAPKDPNGGGWALFIVMILGIMLIPYIIISIAHCLLILLSFLKRNKKVKVSKGLGIAGSICALLVNVVAFGWMALSALSEPTSWEIWVVVLGALLFVAYQAATLTLFAKMKVQK